MNIPKLHGVIPPIITPMHADGSLNLDAMPVLIDFMLAQGVHAIFTCGSQGESFALSADEKRQVIEAVLAAVNGRVPVIAGTGTITTRDTITLTRQAQQAGVDAVSIITPYFITPSQDELYAHYAAVADAVPVPILAYSNPGRTGGVRITPELMGRLAHDIPNIIGVKDSSGDIAETAAMIRACPPGFQTFVGRDTVIYAALCHGAAGAVALTANVVPGLLVGIYDAFYAGDHARALELQQKLSAFRDAIPRLGSYPVQIKEALMLMGLPAGPARLPVQPLNEKTREQLRGLLRAVGVEVLG